MESLNKVTKKLRFIYIYLNKEIQQFIKTTNLNSILPVEEESVSNSSRGRWLMKIALRSFVMSFLVFFTMVYIHQGSLIFNVDGSAIFNWLAAFEFSTTVVFLFMVFLTHRGISKLINNFRLIRYGALTRGLLEALLVIITTVVLLYFFLLLPFRWVFPEIEIPEDRVRFNNVVMAIITLFFYYLVEREKSKKLLQREMLRAARLQKENFQAQLQNLKSQVSPHFLFNSLNTLVSLIPLDADRATEFTRRLSEVYRSFLDNSSEELIPLQKELEIVEAYIYLLKTRFGESVEFSMQISPEVKELQLPPGSLQALIENAIKHNGSTRRKPLHIEIYSEGEMIVVRNNLQQRLEQMESTKTGLENIKSRYYFLSDRLPEFIRNEKDFVVKLPLLKVETHENDHH